MFSLKARIARRLGMKCVDFGAKVCGNVSLGKMVYIASGAQLIARGPEEIDVGDNSFVHRGSLLLPYGGKIKIGKNVGVNAYCIIYGAEGGTEIGDDVLIGAFTMIISSNHNFSRTDIPINQQGLSSKGIKIGNDVWIGARVTILDGVEIGQGAVIGAGSLVSESIPAYSVAVGSPARVIRSRK